MIASRPGRVARLGGRIGPFRHRPFAVYWTGGLLSNIGTWLQAVAGSIFVYQLTGSELAVGFLNFAAFLPILLFSVFGGILSDRFDRRMIVVVTHVASAGIAAALALLAFAGEAREIHVIVAAFAINTCYAFAKPSLSSQVPDLVPRAELPDAVGLNSLQFISGQLIGPVIASAVIATAGASWAFAINAVTFVGPILSMAYLYRVRLGGGAKARDRASGAGERPTAGHGRPGANAATGAEPAAGAIGYLRAHRWVLSMLIGIFATSAALEVIRTLAPALAVQGFGQPESSAGLIIAAQSTGSAIGLLLFIPLRKRNLSRQMVVAGYAMQGVALLTVALVSTWWAACLAVAFVGLGFAFCFPVVTGVLQSEVPDEMRGRVMSYHTLFHLGNRPFAALAVGSLATLTGAHAAVLAGVALAPMGLIVTRVAWRQLHGGPDPVGSAAPSTAAAAAVAGASAAAARTGAAQPGDADARPGMRA